VNMLYLVSPSSSVTCPPPIIPQHSVHIVMSSTCTDVMYLDIVGYHSLFFSLLPWVPQCMDLGH
jgi:hypothetical protein